MTIRIRPETPADYRETENLVREAFWNVYAPGASEHYLLHVMRDAENFVPELDFVAEENGRIVGQVVFMKARIECDDGCCREVLSLGPIAVEPPLQKRGIGRALIEHGAAAAAKLGYQAVLLCGDPRVYAKLGFEPAEKYGIRTSENNYFAALHVRPLNGNLLAITQAATSRTRSTTSRKGRSWHLMLRFLPRKNARTHPHSAALSK